MTCEKHCVGVFVHAQADTVTTHSSAGTQMGDRVPDINWLLT